MTSLDKAIGYIIEDEGPEFNVSADEPGGASRRGVSRLALADYCKIKRLPSPSVADVGKIDDALARDVYTEIFAKPLRLPELPHGVDYRLLDAAASIGVTGACLATQMGLGMWPVSGVMDDETVKAIHAEDARTIIMVLDAAWIVWKHGQTPDGWKKYGHGWTNRGARVRDRSIAMIEGEEK